MEMSPDSSLKECMVSSVAFTSFDSVNTLSSVIFESKNIVRELENSERATSELL